MNLDLKTTRLEPSLELLFYQKVVPTFCTKKEAAEFAASVGWRKTDVLRVSRRFEKVWVAGCKLLQPDDVAGIVFDVYRFPTGTYWDRKQHVAVCRAVRRNSL